MLASQCCRCCCYYHMPLITRDLPTTTNYLQLLANTRMQLHTYMLHGFTTTSITAAATVTPYITTTRNYPHATSKNNLPLPTNTHHYHDHYPYHYRYYDSPAANALTCYLLPTAYIKLQIHTLLHTTTDFYLPPITCYLPHPTYYVQTNYLHATVQLPTT